MLAGGAIAHPCPGSKPTMKKSSYSITGRVTLAALFLTLGFVLLLFAFSTRIVRSAAPPTGTLTPASSPLTFDGTATGTGAANGESSCMEDISCDTFTLTVGGTQADWTTADKRIEVTITPPLPASDFDVVIH